jgi:hypothetical protein
VLLRRWLWRGAIAEKLGGASASLQQHVEDIGEDEHVSVQALLRRTGQPAARPERAPNVENGFSVAHARGKLVLCALWSRIPRSLVDGEKLVASDLFDGAVDEVLRRIVPAATPAFGRSVANRLLHPREGVAAARLVTDCLDEGALASHGIDLVSRDLLREGRFGDFLARRAAVLDAWITELFDARAEWERDDAPPVEAIASRRAAS